jgi:hypothetical protein
MANAVSTPARSGVRVRFTDEPLSWNLAAIPDSDDNDFYESSGRDVLPDLQDMDNEVADVPPAPTAAITRSTCLIAHQSSS